MACYLCGKEIGDNLGLCEDCKGDGATRENTRPSSALIGDEALLPDRQEQTDGLASGSNFERASVEDFQSSASYKKPSLPGPQLLFGLGVLLSFGTLFAIIGYRVITDDGRPAPSDLTEQLKRYIQKSARCASDQASFEYFQIHSVGGLSETAQGFPIYSSFSMICNKFGTRKHFLGDGNKITAFARKDILDEWEVFQPTTIPLPR